MGNAIRKIVTLGQDRMLSFEVPPDMGDSVELILLTCSADEVALEKGNNVLSEDETFLISSYSAVIEEDLEEDKVWERYLHVS